MEAVQRLFAVLIAAWLCFGLLETVFGPEDEGLGVLSGLCAPRPAFCRACVR